MINTERLVLRRWQDSDRKPFAAMGQDAEVMRHFPALLTRAQSDALIDRCNAAIDAKGYAMWAIERRADAAFLGFTGLWDVDFASPIETEIEIGWRLARHAWGQGHALEAARAALDFGWRRLSAQRFVSMTVPANTRSCGLMLRLGLTHRPELAFDHPRIASGHPLRPHIVHAIDRPWPYPP